jgi:hypothetical protein
MRRKEYKMNRVKKPTKEELGALMNELGSMGKVAAALSIPYGTIRTWFNGYKLDRPESCRTIFHELRHTPFSDVQKSVVLGSVLGDGGLVIPKHGKNAKLTIKHCTKQKGYLEWKKKLLDPFSRPIYKTSDPGEVIICGVKSFCTGSFACYTMCHPDLTEFYKQFYVSGYKRVNHSIINDLDLLALAIWIADDGSFYSSRKWNNVLGGKLCTNSFYYEEQLILVKALDKFFDGRIVVTPWGRKKDQFVLKLSGSKTIKKLLDMVKSILPESIHYKLDPQRLYAKLPVVG